MDGKRDGKGFSLAELLIVVVVLALIAAIAIPLYLNQQKKALDATAKTDMHNLIQKMEVLQPQPVGSARWKVTGVGGTLVPPGITAVGSGAVKSPSTQLLGVALDCSYDGSNVSDSPGRYIIWSQATNNVTNEFAYDSASGAWFSAASGLWTKIHTCPNGFSYVAASY